MKKFGISRRSFFTGAAGLGTGAMLAPSAFLASKTLFAEPFSENFSPIYGAPPGFAKLNANENPYGPSPLALKAMIEASKSGAYYVRDSAQKLREVIAEKNGLTPDHIMLSSGSSGVLTYMATATASRGNILGPDLFWDTTAMMGARNSDFGIKRLPKHPDLEIDLKSMEIAIDENTAMVHITNPNNPTAMALPPETLRQFCVKASAKTLVLVDEAYNELTESPDKSTMVPLVKEGRNVAVARTFSKIFGLAGMRVGYLIAKPELLEQISKYGLGDYGLNQAGVAGALASYTDESFISFSKSKIVEAREMVTEALKTNGLRALPSQTNFMFVNLGTLDAEQFRVAMERRKVLIRGIYRDYTNWSRVSMGKLDDVKMYIDAIPHALDAIS